jgi:release factor glutamine methyltransferase
VQLKPTLASAIERLTAEHVPSPRMNAELLLMFALSCDRAYLFAHPERELTEEESARYDEALGHRARGVPAQYITGHQEFWGLDLIVGPAVLIPRPETEHVVETVVELAKSIHHDGHEGPQSEILRSSSGASDRSEIPPLSGENESVRDDAAIRGIVHSPTGEGARRSTGLMIVDVGTGSGAIALALAKELPEAEIHATDVSPAALEVAEANAARLQMESRVMFHDGDLLAELPENAFDFVVSNPPYVGDAEEDQVQLEVRKYEPRGAVFAGPTGVEVIARLLPAARRALKPGGWLVMEISGTIAERVRTMLSGWDEVEITRDLQGIERVVRARKP